MEAVLSKNMLGLVAVGSIMLIGMPLGSLVWAMATTPDYHMRPIHEEVLARMPLAVPHIWSFELECQGEATPRVVKIIDHESELAHAYIEREFPDCEILSSWRWDRAD